MEGNWDLGRIEDRIKHALEDVPEAAGRDE
jgi:hypothetical protein